MMIIHHTINIKVTLLILPQKQISLFYNWFFNLAAHSLHKHIELLVSHIILIISGSFLDPFPHSAQVPNLSAPTQFTNF